MKRLIYTELGRISFDDTNCTSMIDVLTNYQKGYEPHSVVLRTENGLYNDQYYAVVHVREETDEEYDARITKEQIVQEAINNQSSIDRLMAKPVLTIEEKKQLIDLIMETK